MARRLSTLSLAQSTSCRSILKTLQGDFGKEREVRGLIDQDRIYNTISKQDVVDTLTLDLDIKIQVDPPCGGEARSVGGAPATGRISMCHHFQYKRFNGRFLEGGFVPLILSKSK